MSVRADARRVLIDLLELPVVQRLCTLCQYSVCADVRAERVRERDRCRGFNPGAFTLFYFGRVHEGRSGL